MPIPKQPKKSETAPAPSDRMTTFLAAARATRDSILAERHNLLRRMLELDHEMAMLPIEVRREVALPLTSGISYGVPDLVRNQLHAAGKEGMTPERLIAALNEIAPGVGEANIYTALTRGVKSGEFTRTGTRGSFVYRVADLSKRAEGEANDLTTVVSAGVAPSVAKAATKKR